METIDLIPEHGNPPHNILLRIGTGCRPEYFDLPLRMQQLFVHHSKLMVLFVDCPLADGLELCVLLQKALEMLLEGDALTASRLVLAL